MLKDFRTVWAGCLRSISAEIGEQSFRTWFQPIVPIELKGNVLTIQVPSAYFYDWLEEHYVDELRRALFQELGSEGRLEYSVVVDQGNEQTPPRALHLPPPRKQAAPDPRDAPQTMPTAPTMGNPLAGSARAGSARYVASGTVRTTPRGNNFGNSAGNADTLAPPRNPFYTARPVDGNLVPSQLNG